MGSWFVRPETRRIPLSDAQWILVKDRLTAGEWRAHLKRSSTITADGLRQVDGIERGLSLILAYLIDWSLDAPIQGVSVTELTIILDTLDPDRFDEIRHAIDAHEDAMNAARDEKKTTPTGATPSDPTSPLSSTPAPGSVSPTSATLM